MKVNPAFAVRILLVVALALTLACENKEQKMQIEQQTQTIQDLNEKKEALEKELKLANENQEQQKQYITESSQVITDTLDTLKSMVTDQVAIHLSAEEGPAKEQAGEMINKYLSAFANHQEALLKNVRNLEGKLKALELEKNTLSQENQELKRSVSELNTKIEQQLREMTDLAEQLKGEKAINQDLLTRITSLKEKVAEQDAHIELMNRRYVLIATKKQLEQMQTEGYLTKGKKKTYVLSDVDDPTRFSQVDDLSTIILGDQSKYQPNLRSSHKLLPAEFFSMVKDGNIWTLKITDTTSFWKDRHLIIELDNSPF